MRRIRRSAFEKIVDKKWGKTRNYWDQKKRMEFIKESFELANNSSKFILKNVTREDYGNYRCILINSIVSVFREFQIIVEVKILILNYFYLKYFQNTRPQCFSQSWVECFGQNGLSLSWMPGYSGTNSSSQLFRIFYKKMNLLNDENDVEEEENGWMMGELTNHAKYKLENLEKFSEYKLKLEASNRFGPINCTFPGRHFSEYKFNIFSQCQ
jgi:hypothetical protein